MNALRTLPLVLISVALSCQAQSGEPSTNPSALAENGPPVQPPVAPERIAPGGADAGSYVIGPSDVLSVTVWKQPALSGTLLVRPDGMVSMPLVRDLQASGLTPEQLSDEITTGLRKYIQDPSVSVVLTQVHSKVVYTLGEVGKKGPVELTPGMTLLQALSSAGGLTDYANKGKIYILRTQDGKQVKVPIRYKEALKGDSNCNVVLKPGDTIVVP